MTEDTVVAPGELPESPEELEALAAAGEVGTTEAAAEDAPAEVAEEEASPIEPDESPEEDVGMPEEDEKGIVTELSPDMFKKLRSAWLTAGSPHRLTAFGQMWHVYDDGTKFVARGPQGAMGDYGSLSTSRVSK